MEGNSHISISHDYTASSEAIYSMIAEGKLFKLTGADEITFDFSENGPFELKFTGRGRIHGQILKLIPNEKVVLQWDVDGFDMDLERDTKVWITILHTQGHTTVTIEHREIPTEESAAAKKKAWPEILNELT